MPLTNLLKWVTAKRKQSILPFLLELPIQSKTISTSCTTVRPRSAVTVGNIQVIRKAYFTSYVEQNVSFTPCYCLYITCHHRTVIKMIPLSWKCNIRSKLLTLHRTKTFFAAINITIQLFLLNFQHLMCIWSLHNEYTWEYLKLVLLTYTKHFFTQTIFF